MQDRSRTYLTLPSGLTAAYTLWPPEASALHERKVVVHLHGAIASGDDVHLMIGNSDNPAAIEAMRPHVVLIGLDRPGFGGSDAMGTGRPSLLAAAACVPELMAALGIERYGVVGFSAGGPVSLALAALAPAGLERVVTVASPWYWEGRAPSDQPDLWADLAACAWWPVHMALSLVMGPWLLSLLVSPGLAEPLGTSMARYYAQGAWAAAWEQTQLSRSAGFQLSDVRTAAPVHVFQGTTDDIVPPYHAQRLVAQLPSSKLHLIEGAHHFSIARQSHDIFGLAAGLYSL